MCVIDCSTPPPNGGTGSINGTNGNCSGLVNSVCVAAAGTSTGWRVYTIGSFCGFTSGVCATGDCGSGLSQCQGSWDNTSEGSPTLTVSAGPAPPASLFEFTDAGAATTYDVSNIGRIQSRCRYTVLSSRQRKFARRMPHRPQQQLSLLLQVTEPPTSTGTGISCGMGTYCRTGAAKVVRGIGDCVSGNTCVIGCNGPSNAPPLVPTPLYKRWARPA